VTEISAVRGSQMSLQGISGRGVAIVVMGDPAAGADRERPVRIVLTSAQAAELERRLQAVVDEL
jgi:hypothetical protein